MGLLNFLLVCYHISLSWNCYLINKVKHSFFCYAYFACDCFICCPCTPNLNIVLNAERADAKYCFTIAHTQKKKGEKKWDDNFAKLSMRLPVRVVKLIRSTVVVKVDLWECLFATGTRLLLLFSEKKKMYIYYNHESSLASIGCFFTKTFCFTYIILFSIGAYLLFGLLNDSF